MTRTSSSLKCDRFDKICRTCLSEIQANGYISLFKTYLGDKVVKDVLEHCAGVRAEETDSLPPNMCNSCLIKLISSNTFIQQCQESEVLLRSILNTQKTPGGVKSEESGILEIIVETTESYSETESPDEEVVSSVTNENQQEDASEQYKHEEKVKTEFTCKICKEVFNTLENLRIHQKKANHKRSAKNYVCSYCNKAFLSRDHLNRHIRTHTKEKPYHCGTCGMRFSMVQNLRRHEKLHTGERPYKCEICGKGFIQRVSLTNHKKTDAGCATLSQNPNYLNHKENPECSLHLRCEHCGKTFKRLIPYNLHLKRHLPKTEDQGEPERKDYDEKDARMYVCDICKKGYKNKNTLKTHQLTHGEKKFLCSECGKGFVTKAALDSHEKVHTKEKPHTCGICFKSFAYTGSFDTHMLVHTGEKKFVCKICSKSFKQGTHLKYHLRVHSGERPYSCPYCGKSFAVKGNLTVHVRTHTGETPFFCPVCAKGFYDSGSLKKHRRCHGEVNVSPVVGAESEKSKNDIT